MSEPIKLAAFCGSLRKASFNRMVLEAFAARLPAGCTMQTLEVGDWPQYDADLQAKGFPDKILAAQKTILDAGAVVFASPEYNYSVPGALKNAIDWLSRTTPQPFAGKPVAILGASQGLLGSARMQYHLRQILVFLDAHPVNRPEVMIAQAQTKFVDGKLTDEATGKMLEAMGASITLAVRKTRAASAIS
jgi:chromate reductase